MRENFVNKKKEEVRMLIGSGTRAKPMLYHICLLDYGVYVAFASFGCLHGK